MRKIIKEGKPMRKVEKVIKIKEDVRIGDVILEAGDKIKEGSVQKEIDRLDKEIKKALDAKDDKELEKLHKLRMVALKQLKNEKIIVIKEDVKIGNKILEAGDRIKVLESITEISVDLAVEVEDLAKYLKDVERKFNIRSSITDLEGAGGGWPDVMFTGKEQDLLAFYNYMNGGINMSDEFYDFFN